jgi:uncharacterized membrane protein
MTYKFWRVILISASSEIAEEEFWSRQIRRQIIILRVVSLFVRLNFVAIHVNSVISLLLEHLKKGSSCAEF